MNSKHVDAQLHIYLYEIPRMSINNLNDVYIFSLPLQLSKTEKYEAFHLSTHRTTSV